ncbi:MAG: nucleotidyltransferase domain-containing protein [Deltaproteobacteria bacterium]|nr:nucleotidyltransferase domain-containing protein [Deltaproteobacteria bacterium]
MRFVDTIEHPKTLRLKQALRRQGVLTSFFKRQPVELVFLHGALAKDRMKALSDVDIAVLFKDEKYSYENISKIILKLEDILKREDIDLGVLNHASPLFGMQVLKNGILLYARSPRALKNFRLQAIQRYLSTAHLRTTFNRRAAEAVLRGSP